MKYTIEGFSQEIALKLGLDAKDLVLLRWIVDFHATDRMEKHYFDRKEYFWVDYRTVIQDLPILAIGHKVALRRRLRNIEKSGLVEFRVFPGAGNRTFYRFKSEILSSLLSNKTRGGLNPKVYTLLTRKFKGSKPKSLDYIYDPNTIDPNTKDKYIGAVDNFFDTLEQNEQEWLTHIKGAYPKIDIKSEFKKMKAWLISNTNQRKVNLKRFAVNWLNRTKTSGFAPRTSVIDESLINNRLGKIATKEMIKDFLREIPEETWNQVAFFLKKRYPASNNGTFSDCVRELRSEAESNKGNLKTISAGIGKNV